MMLQHFHRFVEWKNSDPKNIIRPLLLEMSAIANAFDEEHERFFQSGYKDTFYTNRGDNPIV